MSYSPPTTSSLDEWLKLLGSGDMSNVWSNYMGMMGPIMKQYFEREPTVPFAAYQTLAGINQPGNYRNWLSNQFERYYGDYQTAASLDPTLWFGDYLKRVNPQRDFSFTAPFFRGEKPELFQPTLRMMR